MDIYFWLGDGGIVILPDMQTVDGIIRFRKIIDANVFGKLDVGRLHDGASCQQRAAAA